MGSSMLEAKRHAWVWTALPASARTVLAVGDPGLAGALAACGYEIVERAPADAVLITDPGGNPSRTSTRPGERLTAFCVDAAATPTRRPAWRRVLELVSSPLRFLLARRRAVLLQERLGAAGPADCLMMSDRLRTSYGLGGGLWRRRMPPVAAIVRSTAQPSVLEAILAEVGDALGREISVRALTVVETGKLIAELGDERGRGYILRLAGGPPAPYIEQAVRALAAIGGPSAPAGLSKHVSESLLDGGVGGARYHVAAKVEGRHPHPNRIGTRMWDDCFRFLVELHVFRRTAPQSAGALREALGASLEVVVDAAGESAGARLLELADEIPTRLAGISLGWGHGDFWSENLFETAGGLGSVIDWDASSPHGFPLHDLWDLVTFSERRGRGRCAGERCARVLWPLLEGGDDERTGSYCRATGVPPDPGTVRALALAYWLTRSARELEEGPARRTTASWIEANLRRPLAIATRMPLGPEAATASTRS